MTLIPNLQANYPTGSSIVRRSCSNRHLGQGFPRHTAGAPAHGAGSQLVPLARALRMTRPRLLLADDVGLGKTVEARLIIAELMARRRVHRLLIVAPAASYC